MTWRLLLILQLALNSLTGCTITKAPAPTMKSTPIATRSEARALVNQVLSNPGSWNQMCHSPSKKLAEKLPLFGDYRRDWSNFFIAENNFRLLREHRSEVISEIAQRLPTALTVPPPPHDPTDIWVISTLTKPKQVLEAYLMILLDLNGVEALPALLNLEAELNATPQQPNDREPWAYSPHVQVLSVITRLLKNEEAPGLDKLRPVYNPANRERIVKLAQDFLDTTPPEHFRAAAAMLPEFEFQ